MKLSKVERGLLTFTVLVFTGLLLVTVTGLAVKNGDAAAWLSMLFNAVMAVAAVGAFLTARKWLPQLTTQEGYREAITLVNDYLLPMVDWERLYICLSRLDQISNALHQGNQPMFDQRTEFSRLDTVLEKLESKTESIRLQLRRLATYGLKGSVRYQQELSDLEDVFRTTLVAALSLEKRLREDCHLYSQLKEAEKQYNAVRNDSKKDSVRMCRETWATSSRYVAVSWQVFQDTYGRLTDAHRYLFERGPDIGELFEVRK
jgi:Na+/phosphate symporter